MIPIAPATAATALAAAVTAHNIEEMRSGITAAMRRFGWTTFAFRFAATIIALYFWMLAAGLWLGLPLVPVLTGFAAAMGFNAFVPHLALTLTERRYNPGTATGLLLVVPAASLWLLSDTVSGALADGRFVIESAVGAVFLLVSLPLLLLAGRAIEAVSGLRERRN